MGTAPVHLPRDLVDALQSLPMLGDDLYLRMQAFNLGVVDGFLMNAERELLREYMETERTPMPSAVFVSALSQLWVFGVYELLRTWRQRVSDVLKFVTSLQSLPAPARKERLEAKQQQLANNWPYPGEGDDHRWSFYESASTDRSVARKLQSALDRSETVFRRIEALRIHLAKHELPKSRGSTALAPGYGRIHMENGSIYYQVLLRNNEVDMISRRDVADACRELAKRKTKAMLPLEVRDQLRHVPEVGYGAKQVTVTLRDGSTYDDVFILWDREVSSVGHHPKLPFDARHVVQVHHKP